MLNQKPKEIVRTASSNRISQSARERDGRLVVDLNNYVPHLLSAVHNALSREASQIYLDQFEIGIAEWRVMSMLAIESRIQAAQICDIIKIDKGAASRALSRLDSKGLLGYEALPTDARKRIWWLNEAGLSMHDTILHIALEREQKLVECINPQDLEAFLRVIRAMVQNVESTR